MQNSHGVSFGIPPGYGLKGIIANARLLDKDKEKADIQIDYVINDYVPTEVSPGSRDSEAGIKKLEGANHQTEVKSLEDIQLYINQAGNAQSENDLANNWYVYGPGSMFQRIFSVGRSITKQQNGKLDGVSIMTFKENFINFGMFISFQEGLFNNKIFTEETFNSQIISQNKINEKLAKLMWNAFGGYMFDNSNDLGFSSSNLLNGDNHAIKSEVEPFMNQATLFSFNAPWAVNMANNGWHNGYDSQQNFQAKKENFAPLSESGNAVKDGQIHIFSAPYGDVGAADFLSIASNASPAETLVAKRYMKWIYQLHTNVTYKQTGGRGSLTDEIGSIISKDFISANKQIYEKQEIKAKEENILGFYKMGKKDEKNASDNYNGIGGSAWKSTDGTFLDDLENQLIPKMQKHYGTQERAKTKWTYNQFKNYLDQAVKLYLDEKALA